MPDREVLPRPARSAHPTSSQTPTRARVDARDVRLAEGPGTPLDPALADVLSAALGADLSRVRLHADDFAAELTAALDAEAVTQGEDVFFAPGAYDPMSAAGRDRLAHELYHVVHRQETPAVSGDVHPPEEMAARAVGDRLGHWVDVPWSAPTADVGPSMADPAAATTDLPARRPRWGCSAARPHRRGPIPPPTTTCLMCSASRPASSVSSRASSSMTAPTSADGCRRCSAGWATDSAGGSSTGSPTPVASSVGSSNASPTGWARRSAPTNRQRRRQRAKPQSTKAARPERAVLAVPPLLVGRHPEPLVGRHPELLVGQQPGPLLVARQPVRLVGQWPVPLLAPRVGPLRVLLVTRPIAQPRRVPPRRRPPTRQVARLTRRVHRRWERRTRASSRKAPTRSPTSTRTSTSHRPP